MSSDTGLRYSHPLQVHPKTGEPYIRLPAPHPNIIITPPRATDADTIVAILNDPAVALNLASPPYPYLHAHAVSWLERELPTCREAQEEIAACAAKGGDEPSFVSKCPVQSIREVKEDGEEVHIGEVRIIRSNFFHIRDEEEAKRLEKENNQRAVGDPNIEWFFGDYLASSHHGRGIMTAAIKAIMDWAVPSMGVRHIVITTGKGNIASMRTFEKNGYTHIGVLENCKVYPASKGGQPFSVSVMEWRKI